MDFLPFTKPDIDEATIAGVGEVLRSGWITSGPQVKAFEAALSGLLGGRTVRCFSSGTATLEVGLRLADVGAGDEVLTTPLSWVATAHVALRVAARPVVVDVDPRTRNLDLDLAEKAITKKTKAIIPVDLAGLPVDRDRLYAIAGKHGVRVVEDAAQAFGASWRGRAVGSFGDFVSFSFHANKNLTTAEGGALVLPDASLAARCEQWRLQGGIRSGEDRTEVEVRGGQFNMTDAAASLRLGPLARLRTAAGRLRELELAHVPDRAARKGRARRLHGAPARCRNRHGGALSGHAPLQALPGARLAARAVPARRAHRRLDRHLAALPGDARRGRRPGVRDGADGPGMNAPTISVVIPIYNEAAGLAALFGRLYPPLDALGERCGLILVDDGSRDQSARLLAEQFRRRPDVTRVILLATNFGQHMAIRAGFDRARGELVVTLDADLQNPPEEIAKLVAKWREGYDYVGSYRKDRNDTWFRRAASRLNNRIRERITDIRMTDQGCMLRAYGRNVQPW